MKSYTAGFWLQSLNEGESESQGFTDHSSIRKVTGIERWFHLPLPEVIVSTEMHPGVYFFSSGKSERSVH